VPSRGRLGPTGMNANPTPADRAAVAEAVAQLQEAAAAHKCWACGCLHHALETLDGGVSAAERPPELDAVMRAAHERLVPVRYDCLGCEVCYPARALNALSQVQGGWPADACPTEAVEARPGWPPLPGAYTILRYRAPVAVCTLTDEILAREIAQTGDARLAIVGMLQTENLGIERVIANVVANTHIRFLLVCGADSRQTIGHFPGQSLVALAREGLDDQGRIRGAAGKRPVLKNIGRDAVEHFCRTVEVIDLVGHASVPEILEAASHAATRDPGPAVPFTPERITPSPGYLPSRMIPDPAGYFVIYPDPQRGMLSLEHFRPDGVLDAVIEGHSAAECYTPAVAQGLLSRLDHAAYLGRELARAEAALHTGARYVQDAAAETAAPATPEPGCCTTQATSQLSKL
jgi:tetrahydromethanopterin S-methyltransferase subunit A